VAKLGPLLGNFLHTPLRVSVRLGLGLWLSLGFIFYIYFVSTRPTALSSCVTDTSQVAYE